MSYKAMTNACFLRAASLRSVVCNNTRRQATKLARREAI